jgi:DNA-binding NarL/FixJ family response regulator
LHVASIIAARDRHARERLTSGSGRIILADDHPLFRRGLAEAANLSFPGLEVEEVESLAGLLSSLRHGGTVELVLLDLRLPDCSDFAGLRAVRERFPTVPVAVVSALDDALTISGAMRLGAMGFIPKSSRMTVLTEAICRIMAGEIWTPPSCGAAQPAHARVAGAGLTPAQMRIISGLQRGLLNKQIAFELGVTEHTVKAHMTAAFRKLGVENRLQAMVLLRGESVSFAGV